MPKHYVDEQGRYLGEYADGLAPPVGAIEVSEAPLDHRQLWTGLGYAPVVIEVANYTVAVQQHLDAAAVAAGYDDIKSAVTYADEAAVATFQAEGQAFRQWRSLCWQYCLDQYALVAGGQRSAPAIAELIAELPALELPQDPVLVS